MKLNLLWSEHNIPMNFSIRLVCWLIRNVMFLMDNLRSASTNDFVFICYVPQDKQQSSKTNLLMDSIKGVDYEEVMIHESCCTCEWQAHVIHPILSSRRSVVLDAIWLSVISRQYSCDFFFFLIGVLGLCFYWSSLCLFVIVCMLCRRKLDISIIFPLVSLFF